MKEPCHPFATASEWRNTARQRDCSIDALESARRRSLAAAHNSEHGITDADTLADQELYILGKMELQEYQDYLLFKHSPAR